MEWKYKGITITVNSNHLFEYEFEGQRYTRETAKAAELHIDSLTRGYYTITEADIKTIMSKLSIRHKAFIEDALSELSRHDFNPYCELGVHMDFDWSKTHYYKED